MHRLSFHAITSVSGLPGLLFVASLLALPFAEWRVFVLPINEKDFGIDLSGLGSASLFDLVFFAFCFSMLPMAWDSLRRKELISPFLAWWVPASALVFYLYWLLQPLLPFLTPPRNNVIETRSFLINFAVAVFVTIFVSRIPLERIVKASFVYYCVASAVFLLLCVLAFYEFPYFFQYYPFRNPATLSFPFPSQNVAAPFITVCLLGLLGTGICLRKNWPLFLGAPVLVLAAALTGSRSNMLLLMLSVFLFAAAHAWVAFAGNSRDRRGIPRIRPFTFMAILAVAVGLIVLSHDWQPVRRSLSLFARIFEDPGILIRSDEGSPRSELWNHARNRDRFPDLDDNRNFALSLVRVNGGCAEKSAQQISNLRPGRTYHVRLTISPDGNMTNATLQVYSDSAHEAPIGGISTRMPGVQYRRFYPLMADSDRRLTIVRGSLSDFRLSVDGGWRSFDPEALSRLEMYQDRHSGGPKPVISTKLRAIVLDADEKFLKGYLRDSSDLPDSAWRGRVTLEYAIRLDAVTQSMPLDPLAMFYIGFQDGDSPKGDQDWDALKNALLIQHTRHTSPLEAHYYSGRAVEELFILRAQHAGLTDDELLRMANRARRCGENGANLLRNVWHAPAGSADAPGGADALGSADADLAKGDLFNAKILSDTASAISTVVDEGWSAERHLKYRGSTHNVYLDWYYYVGPGPLLLFVALVACFLGALCAHLWLHRATPYFPFLVATALQVFVLFALMYAQPNIFIKFFWVIFGIASGIMISRSPGDTRRHA